MGTQKFRTRTEFIKKKNGNCEGSWVIGADIGYSGVKLLSPNQIATFPSYAKRISADFAFAGQPPKEAILYKDNKTGEMWLIGEIAQNTIETGNTSDSEASLYGRERYQDPMFKVLLRAGLGTTLRSNEFGGPGKSNIVVQTGLPEMYMNDEDDLREAFTGEHAFSLKIGNGNWLDFDFVLNDEDIYVMSQPKGTLFSTCIDSEGRYTKDARNILNSSIIIFDPGFGTLDLFLINNGVVVRGETFSDLGMKRILQETSSQIYKDFKVEIAVPAMQKYLQAGTVRYFNRKTLESREYEFADILSLANDKICDEALNRMSNAVNLADYNYIAITGGTGAAWYKHIEDKFKGLSTLKILRGNQNDESLPFIYSNARGYYYYRLNKELRKLKAA